MNLFDYSETLYFASVYLGAAHEDPSFEGVEAEPPTERDAEGKGHCLKGDIDLKRSNQECAQSA
jgi:hypothetical protein